MQKIYIIASLVPFGTSDQVRISPKTIPQGLKPVDSEGLIGTTEVVPRYRACAAFILSVSYHAAEPALAVVLIFSRVLVEVTYGLQVSGV